jgi:hypothetical protein
MPDIPIPIETDDDTLRRQAAPIPVPMHPAYGRWRSALRLLNPAIGRVYALP